MCKTMSTFAQLNVRLKNASNIIKYSLHKIHCFFLPFRAKSSFLLLLYIICTYVYARHISFFSWRNPRYL